MGSRLLKDKSRIALIVPVVLILAFFSCTPSPSITDLKYSTFETLYDNEVNCFYVGVVVISWTTNTEARCQVQWCEGDLCYWSDLEPEYSMLHQFTIYEFMGDSIVIMGEDRCGARFQYDVGAAPSSPLLN